MTKYMDSKRVSDLATCARYVLAHLEQESADGGLGEALSCDAASTADAGGYWDVGIAGGLDLTIGSEVVK